jgi:hypothetical protein
MRIVIYAAVSLLLAAALPCRCFSSPIELYIVAGQSNVTGAWGPPPASVAGVQDVPYRYWMYTDAGLFSDTIQLQPLSGIVPAATFSVELSFAQRLAQTRPVAIVKVAWIGSGAPAWLPERENLFPHLLTQVNLALADLTADGYEPTVAGLLWVQGEADATIEWAAQRYAQHIRAIFAAARHHYGDFPMLLNQLHSDNVTNPTMPFVDIVREQQREAAFAEGIRMVNGDDLPIDRGHFSPEMSVALGERFAQAILNPADFDFNGHVDGADFLEWQRIDGSADTLAAWTAAMSPPEITPPETVPPEFMPPTSIATPEPAASVLAAFGLLASRFIRRRAIAAGGD